MAHLLTVDKLTPQSAKKLEDTSMILEGWSEPDHLEAWIVAHPDVLDPTLKIITTQFSHWESDDTRTRDRLDVLALADSGELVVIELKRGRDRNVHLQALTYAALVSGFTRDVLAEAHHHWLRGQGRPEVTVEEARKELEGHVEGEWTDDLLTLPRMILVAENFPDQVITTITWLSEVAEDLTIEAHEYSLFDHGDTMAVSFQRIFPVEDLERRRLRPGTSDRHAEVKAQLSTNRRRARSVALLHEAKAIPDSSRIELSLQSMAKPDVAERIAEWLKNDPSRSDVRWRNHRSRPLVWAAADDPDQQWSPTALRDAIFERAVGEAGTFSAAEAWQYNGRSLYWIAQDYAE